MPRRCLSREAGTRSARGAACGRPLRSLAQPVEAGAHLTRDCTSRARSPRAPAAVILHPEQRSSARPANDTWKRPSFVVRTRRVFWPKLTVTRSPALKCEPETTSGLLFAITSRGAAAEADGTTTAAARATISARFMPTMYRARGGFKPLRHA